MGIVLIPFAFLYLKEVKIETSQDDLSVNIGKNMIIVYILAFIYMLLFFILPTQIPFLLIEKFDASGKMAGTVIATAFFCNALGAIAFSRLKKRLNFVAIYLIGITLIALGFSLVGIINHIYFFFITSPILGFAGGLMMTNVTAWMLSKTSHQKRVKSSGYFTSAIFLGQFLSPIVFHPFLDFLEIQDFFLFIGLSLFLISFIAFLVLRFKTKSKQK